MAKSEIIKKVARHDNLTEEEADFLEQIILMVRENCATSKNANVESVINNVLDRAIERNGNREVR